jgi:hypothetical protein
MSLLAIARQALTDQAGAAHESVEPAEITPREVLPPAAATPPRSMVKRHRVPTNCLGKSMCWKIGICGRESCVPDAELRTGEWTEAILAARSTDNPHRIPAFDPIDEASLRSPIVETTPHEGK